MSERSVQRALHRAKTTFRDELDRHRIEKAKALLADASTSLERVASEMGFASSQHFATAFRRLTGEPPGAFRARRGGGRSS